MPVLIALPGSPSILALTLSSAKLRKNIKTVIHLILPSLKDALKGKDAALSERQRKLINKLLDNYATGISSKALQETIRKAKGDLENIEWLERLLAKREIKY